MLVNNDDNAPPPPYRAHCGFDDAAGSSADAQTQDLIDLGDNDNSSNTPHVSPPSYEATASSPSRETTTANASHRTDKNTQWNPFQSLVNGGSSSSAPSSSSSLDCGHWAARGCSLTSGPQRCCACFDQRDVRADGRYPVYIDGLGDKYGSTTRWAHYCSPCQAAERAQHAYYKKGSAPTKEVQQPDATELRRARHEARRQAEIQRVSREKAKNAVEQHKEQSRRQHEKELEEKERIRNVQLRSQAAKQRYSYEQNHDFGYMTHTKKHERRQKHAQRMAEQEQAADERAAKAREGAEQQRKDNAAEITVLRELRKQIKKQAEELEVQLAGKRARIVQLDQQIRLLEPRPVPAASGKSMPGFANMSPSDRAALAEKAALAETYGISSSAAPASSPASPAYQDHPRGVPLPNAYELKRQSAAVSLAANLPLLSEKTGGSSSSAGPSNASASASAFGSGSGSWLGRVFGRKGKEKEREPGPGENYYAESFYAQMRAEAEARAQVKEYLDEKEKK